MGAVVAAPTRWAVPGGDLPARVIGAEARHLRRRGVRRPVQDRAPPKVR